MSIKRETERKMHATALACAAVLLSGVALAQTSDTQSGQTGQSGQGSQSTQADRGSQEDRAAQTDETNRSSRPTRKATERATERVSDALGVVRQLEAEPRMKQLLQQGKGVLIIPSYGKAALGVGAQGGAGLLLLKRADGAWSGPAFYDLGGLSIGLQAGAEGGPIAMVLNNDKAVNEFMKKNNVALTADAGLTVLNWSKMAQGTAGTGDVVAWSAKRGLFGDAASVGLSGIRFNQSLTNAYYGRTLTPKDIVAGKVSNPQAEPLQQALGEASTTTR